MIDLRNMVLWSIGFIANQYRIPPHQISLCPLLVKTWRFYIPINMKPAQESFKRYTSLEIKGVMQPKIWLRFPETRDIRYFRTKLCLTSWRPLLTTFATKSYMLNETYIAYKFYALYHQTGDFLEENSCLCAENVMRVLDTFFLHIKSWSNSTFMESISGVISATKRFALKITLKF